MKIIIEGTDGSGKSTLAKYLSKTMNYPIVHRSKPENEQHRLQMLQDYMDSADSDKNEIWDRAFYSEMVYGKVMRDQSCIDLKEMLQIESILAQKGAYIIWCTGDATSMWHNCKKRGESYITTIEQLWTIDNEYDKLFFTNTHLIPIMKYKIEYGKVPSI